MLTITLNIHNIHDMDNVGKAFAALFFFALFVSAGCIQISKNHRSFAPGPCQWLKIAFADAYVAGAVCLMEAAALYGLSMCQ